MMSENNDGGQAIPWYHRAYDALLQETPYSFKRPPELLDATSCPRAAARTAARDGAAVLGQPLDRHHAGAEALERGEGQHREALLRRVTPASAAATCSPT